MRTIRYEYMRPQEILDAQAEKSIIYLPVGPLEWHSPAMPFGTDPLAAEASARKAAERTGFSSKYTSEFLFPGGGIQPHYQRIH
ncbi:MAG: creatininase family protein [Suilimivivens sp.]